ncbi:hypothetical protein [Actinoplanes philippinensis]|uniref:hypothetical protein n=1 Tax=Actinoplanes philippinensis TaxID=35752 RepID=UPI003404A8B2
MIRRIRDLLRERRSAARISPGWETDEGVAELRRLVKEARAESAAVPVVPGLSGSQHAPTGEFLARDYLARHDGTQEIVTQTHRVPTTYWDTDGWRPYRLPGGDRDR